MVEVTVAMILVSLGALTTLSCMLTTSEVETEVRERGIALRAANSQMERVLSFDYEGDVDTLLAWASDPANARFSVEDLKPAGAPNSVASVGQGMTTVDATDPERIQITVTVTWEGRRGSRSVSLPVTITELVQ